MGKRISISQPAEISTELAPLIDSFWLEGSGELEQWYYENTGDAQPDRQLIPLVITPHIEAHDPDSGETLTPAFYQVLWYVMEWDATAGSYVERQVTAVEDTLTEPYVIDGQRLIVHRNLDDATHAATVRCSATYIDPRDPGYKYAMEDTLTLTVSRDATKRFPVIDIATESVIAYNPLKDASSLRSLNGVVTDYPMQAEDVELFAYRAEVGGTEQVLPLSGADGVKTTAPTLDIRYGSHRTTDNTFIERTTAGGAVGDISDGTAHVYGMRGNTVKWNQLIQNGDFSNGTNGWINSNGLISVNEEGQLVNTKKADYNNWFGKGVVLFANHVYVLSIDIVECNIYRSIRATNGNYSAQPYIGIGGISSGEEGKMTKAFKVEDNYTHLWIGGATTSGVLIIVDNISIFDLTEMFGTDAQIAAALGITEAEITTEAGTEAFEAWLSEHVGQRDYYAYDEGSLVPVKLSGMKSTGSDGESEAACDVTQLTGKLNGTGNSVTIFPDGLKRVGDVYDEIVVKDGVLKAIKRVVGVDLGTLTWSYNSSKKYFNANLTGIIKLGYKDATSACLVTKYRLCSDKHMEEADVDSYDMYIAIPSTSHAGSLAHLRNLQYTSSSDLNVSLSGVYLYYKLATPQEYTIDMGSGQVTFEWYGVDGNGTEQRIDTLPCYVSGQHTDTVTVDAQYAECTPVILRCKQYPHSETLLPSYALRTIQWRIPDIDAIATCMNGAAVREANNDYRFVPIVNVKGATLSDAVKAAHLRFRWQQRLWSTTGEKFRELGYGQSMVVNAAKLRNQRQGDTLRSAPVHAIGELVTPHASFELEKSSSPAFSVTNAEAAEDYIGEMGGYLFLLNDGHVYAAKLNPSSWSTLIDGTPVTAALEQKTETMVHVPDCHFRGDGKRLSFGGLTPVHNGHVFDSPHWVGAYKISLADGMAHSRPDVAPQHSKTMEQFWQEAQALGTDFGLANYQFHCLVNAVYQAKYGNLNSQATIGAGFSTSSWEAARDIPMGLLRSLGDGSGNVLYNDSTIGSQHPVKLFGFEDLWAKMWEFRPGIRFYMDGDVRKAVVYTGNVVSNTATGREFVCTIHSASDLYVKSMELGEWWDMIAQNVRGAGASTYYTDSYYAATDGQLLYVGGRASYGALCGLAFASSYYAFSYSASHLGARLAYYAEPEIISGARLAALASE